MLRGLGHVLSFLTIAPSPAGTLERTAASMHLFPAAGLLLGLVAGSFAFGMSYVLDPLLVGVLVAASLAMATGMHHADGLADLADGLMARGGRERRIAAMRDTAAGSGGVVATVLCMGGLVAAVSLAEGPDLLRGILVSEVLAKFSMVLLASLGRPAAPGSGAAFVSAMGDRRRLAAASALTLVPVLAVGGAAGALMLAAAVAAVLVLLAASSRGLGGVTGDVLGAANELGRLASMVVFVSI